MHEIQVMKCKFRQEQKPMCTHEYKTNLRQSFAYGRVRLPCILWFWLNINIKINI